MDLEGGVAAHYGRSGIEAAIVAALRADGKDPDRIAPSDLSAMDEFHLGWFEVTPHLVADLAPGPGDHLLDVGSGIGGPARTFASLTGCRVTGIDLTESYVDVATALTRRCGLSDRVAFRQGSALDMPFGSGTFDAATLIHVGMNIADKARLFAEVRRVLKPDGRFCVYEAMRGGDGPIPYPVPWAVDAGTSFVETPATYRRLLAEAGFVETASVDRTAEVLAVGRAMREAAARGTRPVAGLHVLIGPASREQGANVMRAVADGTIVPIQIIARAA